MSIANCARARVHTYVCLHTYLYACTACKKLDGMGVGCVEGEDKYKSKEVQGCWAGRLKVDFSSRRSTGSSCRTEVQVEGFLTESPKPRAKSGWD